MSDDDDHVDDAETNGPSRPSNATTTPNGGFGSDVVRSDDRAASSSSSEGTDSDRRRVGDGGGGDGGGGGGGVIVRRGVRGEITRGVLRKKLDKMRHLVIRGAVSPDYLDGIFPSILRLFDPQTVVYNGGIARIEEWKISCYLEVMEGGVPCAVPNVELRSVCIDLLRSCDVMFAEWYRQQHACNGGGRGDNGAGGGPSRRETPRVERLMTFITRYTPAPGEQALLKHVDGAGKVDGSVVVALPMDRWSGPEEELSFDGHGGGLTFWDGRSPSGGGRRRVDYDTRAGDVAFIDRAVWHQANPITKGTRWAMVIFYKVRT